MPYTPPVNYTPTIEEIFYYRPPTNPEQQQKHTTVNEAAKQFAFVIDANVANSEYKRQILLIVQQASLLSHQAITIDYLNADTPNK